MKFIVFILLLLSLHGFTQTSLFLVAGQSNAVGQGEKTNSILCKATTTYEYKVATDSLVTLADPVGESQLPFEQANTGSLVPAFAKRYYELSAKNLVIVSAARGGSSCHAKAELSNMGTWDTNGKMLLFDKAIDKTKRASIKTSTTLQGIIWLQGERDANAINAGQLTSEEYKNSLVSVIERFRIEMNNEVPFYIVLTGYYANHSREGFDAVRSVQQQVSEQMKKVYVVFHATNQFEEKQLMKDEIHYNQLGLNLIGESIAVEIYRHENESR